MTCCGHPRSLAAPIDARALVSGQLVTPQTDALDRAPCPRTPLNPIRQGGGARRLDRLSSAMSPDLVGSRPVSGSGRAPTGSDSLGPGRHSENLLEQA